MACSPATRQPARAAPGAAGLYVLLSLAAWPRPTAGGIEAPLPTRLLAGTWLLLWLIGTVLALLPAQWGAAGLGDQAAMGWMMAPSWAVRPTLAVAKWLAALTSLPAAALSLAVVIVLLALVLDARRGRPTRFALIAGAGLGLAFWMFGQGFGALTTGTATDVGTGPLVVVLAGAIWSGRNAEHNEPPAPHGRGFRYETPCARGQCCRPLDRPRLLQFLDPPRIRQQHRGHVTVEHIAVSGHVDDDRVEVRDHHQWLRVLRHDDR
ncbi:MAG: hypothetical protein ABI429_03345 [Jatrophihabitantaceae bacterium]